MRILTYPWDLADEGMDSTLDHFRNWGFDSVSVSTNYHAAKLLLPHNPKRRVYFPEMDAAYFPVPLGTFEGLPFGVRVGDWSRTNPDFWYKLAAAAGSRNLGIVAWTIFLHNSTIGLRHPGHVVRNAFGDPYIFNLCPSHPEVRKFAVHWAEQVARLPGIGGIFMEALHFMDFQHGYHHEMTGIQLSEHTEALLGLCFCPSCTLRGENAGIDMRTAQRLVSDEIVQNMEDRKEINKKTRAFTRQWFEKSRLMDFLKFRSDTVTSLVREIKDGVQLPLIYFCPKPERAWVNGIDYRDLSKVVDMFEVYHYERDLNGLQREADHIRSLIGDAQLRLILRGGYPDVQSPAELKTKVDTLSQWDIDGVSLYNYGQVPFENWESLRQSKEKTWS